MLLPRIELDWPSQPLWPNRRKHWAPSSGHRAIQKTAAFYAAKEAGWNIPLTSARVINFTLTFCAPSNRKFDLDNALAAMKGAIDGLSDALGTDDSKFSYTIQRGDPCKDGGVIVVAEVK